ncbi:MAG TPA: T9SS type A sorting domain-containing protein, partial [Bacteroidetes bacterium]|nr:T9SS type A sorting domain-containing protein [Bacteroidota bacterium]
TRYFTYYTPADALPGDCRYIDNIFGNYSTEPSQPYYGLPCLDINWPDPPPYSEVDSAIIKMCELLEEQRLNPEDTLLEEEIHVYFREYNDLMMRYTESLFRQRSYNEIIWLLRQVCDKYWKRILVTTLIKDKQYNEALSELNRLETEGVGDQIYKKTQEIKISHLQLGAKFNLENDDKAYLKEAAVAHVPESAYATALLYQLEGESIFDDEILSSRVNPRNEENQEISNANLSIFPNPVRDLLYLEYKDKDESDNLIKIINSLGEIVYEKFFDFENGNMIEIDMSNIPEGTLFISVLKNNGQILASKKIVHVK